MDVSTYIGWFDRPEQTTPAHDPGDGVICPVCGEPIADRKHAKNKSIMPRDRRMRCYFYYFHPECADDPRRAQIDEDVMDFIEKSEAH